MAKQMSPDGAQEASAYDIFARGGPDDPFAAYDARQPDDPLSALLGGSLSALPDHGADGNAWPLAANHAVELSALHGQAASQSTDGASLFQASLDAPLSIEAGSTTALRVASVAPIGHAPDGAGAQVDALGISVIHSTPPPSGSAYQDQGSFSADISGAGAGEAHLDGLIGVSPAPLHPVTSNASGASAVQQALAETGLSVNGAGVKVGVLSDSFNNHGGAAADEASGALPSAANVQVLSDLSSGGTDEGRAMMQVVHDVAPGASEAFYTAGNSEQDFANGIIALANAGCKVVVDDATYFDEPFFQNDAVAKAIQTVEQQGVVCLSSAGNDAANAYQSGWSNVASASLPDGTIGTNLLNFGGGSVVQNVTLGAGAAIHFDLQWDQAFGQAASNVGMLFYYNGQLLGSGLYTRFNTGFNSTNPQVFKGWYNDTGAAATLQIAIENLSGPNPGLIQYDALGDGATVSIAGANAGTVIGHHMSPYAIAVGAADTASTPSQGVNPPRNDYFSSSGVGTELLFDNNGNRLSTPESLSPVAVTGVDGIATTVSGGLSNFYGTSSAAPSVAGVAALMLEANGNLNAFDIKNLLEDSALAMAAPAVSGAGLVQAAKAVSYAATDTITEDAAHNTLLGTHLNDTFVGGPGSHSIDGGNGTDTIDYHGPRAHYAINRFPGVGAPGTVHVTDQGADGDGSDLLTNVKFVHFTDGDWVTSAPTLWNETAFRAANPDVDAAIHNGSFASGWDFYHVYGPGQGRVGGFMHPAGAPALWNEDQFLASNADVLSGVVSGAFATGWDFYHVYGPNQGRLAGFTHPTGAPSDWDESRFFDANPDVLSAVANGSFVSGWDFYHVYGPSQGRVGGFTHPAGAPILWQEGQFLNANPDVLNGIANGAFASGWDFYRVYGPSEGRMGHFAHPAGAPAQWNEDQFLAGNADVLNGVSNGIFTSGWDFYRAYGPNEGRLGGFTQPAGAPANWDESRFFDANPDVLSAVTNGAFTSGWSFYHAYGPSEGRLGGFTKPAGAPANWDESRFFDANPDVLSAVANGSFTSGWSFYHVYGPSEGRGGGFTQPAGAPSLWQEGQFLNANPDVLSGVANGSFTSGWDFYRAYGPSEGRLNGFAQPSGAPAGWNETQYLDAHTDVLNGVISGQFSSGWQHYHDYGW